MIQDDRASATSDGLRPERYPWRATTRAGVLVNGGFTDTDDPDGALRANGAAPMAGRHRVLAVGSNASPEVMHRKMARAGLNRPLAMTITRTEGIGVGHSAHVSLPGYIAAAPYRCSQCIRRLVQLHLDDEQLDALDATEPNYVRTEHHGAWIYASIWQVIAVYGLPVTLRTQQDLHATLNDADPVWHQRFGGMPPEEVAAELARDGSIGEWRRRWPAVGLTRNAGFDSVRS